MDIRNLLSWFLLLYVIALHTSMAGMEIFAWLITACALGRALLRKDFGLLRANRPLLVWLALLIFSVFMGLALNPLQKPFGFQLGYLRWTILLWGMAYALLEVPVSFSLSRSGKEKETGTSFVTTWMVILAITGAYGLFQCFTGIDFLREGKLYPEGGIYKAVGFFSFSLTYAYSVGISTCAIALPAMRRSWALGLLVIVLGFCGILTSFSRGAWLAAPLVALIYLALHKPKMLLPILAGFGLLVIGLVSFSPGFEAKVRTFNYLLQDHSTVVRLNIWRACWQMFLDHPLFGVGLLEIDKLLPEYFARLDIQQTFVSHAHNNLMQFLAGAGIAGLVSYSAIVFIFLRKAWRLTLCEPVWGWALLLAQLFLHLGGLTEANFINTAVNHFLVFIWAFTLALEFRANKVKRSNGFPCH